MEYLIILVLMIIAGVLLEWKYHVHLYHSRKERIIITLILFVIGTAIDTYQIFRGHWVYPGTGTLGITIGLMPLEDYIFMIAVPFLVLTIYKVLDRKIK